MLFALLYKPPVASSNPLSRPSIMDLPMERRFIVLKNFSTVFHLSSISLFISFILSTTAFSFLQISLKLYFLSLLPCCLLKFLFLPTILLYLTRFLAFSNHIIFHDLVFGFYLTRFPIHLICMFPSLGFCFAHNFSVLIPRCRNGAFILTIRFRNRAFASSLFSVPDSSRKRITYAILSSRVFFASSITLSLAFALFSTTSANFV